MKVFCNTFRAISLEESGLWFCSCLRKVSGIALSLIRTEQNATWTVSCQGVARAKHRLGALDMTARLKLVWKQAATNWKELRYYYSTLWCYMILLWISMCMKLHVQFVGRCRVVPIGLNPFSWLRIQLTGLCSAHGGYRFAAVALLAQNAGRLQADNQHMELLHLLIKPHPCSYLFVCHDYAES